jgi:hypothetical protein
MVPIRKHTDLRSAARSLIPRRVRAVASYTHLLRITCGGCAATWAGEDRAHCASCHRTFDTVSVWDAHRVDGKCQHPRRLGLTATKNGIWLEPLPQERRRRRAS